MASPKVHYIERHGRRRWDEALGGYIVERFELACGADTGLSTRNLLQVTCGNCKRSKAYKDAAAAGAAL